MLDNTFFTGFVVNVSNVSQIGCTSNHSIERTAVRAASGGGGDRGAGDREKRGREVYGRREKRGQEAGFPRWQEAGEKGKTYATLRNILQSKKCKGREPKNTGREPGLKGTGSGRFKPPCPPPPNLLLLPYTYLSPRSVNMVT